jgi:hypothetical protein
LYISTLLFIGGKSRTAEDEETYGYVTASGIPLNSMERIQASRGSIIPETCFEIKARNDDILKRLHWNRCFRKWSSDMVN